MHELHTMYDIVSSATSGGTHALTHAIGQIPPFGIIFSMMHMIQTAINVGTKSIGGGMIALDPIMEIFGTVIGSKEKGAENYHKLIRRIQEAMTLIPSAFEKSAYVQEDCQVENNSTADTDADKAAVDAIDPDTVGANNKAHVADADPVEAAVEAAAADADPVEAAAADAVPKAAVPNTSS